MWSRCHWKHVKCFPLCSHIGILIGVMISYTRRMALHTKQVKVLSVIIHVHNGQAAADGRSERVEIAGTFTTWKEQRLTELDALEKEFWQLKNGVRNDADDYIRYNVLNNQMPQRRREMYRLARLIRGNQHSKIEFQKKRRTF